MAYKKTRSMKVYEKSDYRYQSVPMIRLCGKWLKFVGFDIGEKILVKCENGQLIITPDETGKRLAEEERAFMERETKKLHERFFQEHQMCVAEAAGGYGK